MKITFKKYDPAVDAEPYDLECDVKLIDPKMTVLEAISWANENVEAISFDYSCRGRVCGRCAVMLDGTPVLACITMITDAPHTIEPLKGFPVLRDLIVDRSKSQARVAERYARVRAYPITEEEAATYDMSKQNDVDDMEWCARCMVCTSACPAYQKSPADYIGPAAMLAEAFRFNDPYDQGDRVLEAVQGGLYNCIMCGKCTEVCPQDEINHLKYWSDLRAAAEARGFKPASA